MTDYYAILGVPRGADETSIRNAYRRLARHYHPDMGEGSSADRFREVTEAYETLLDPARRRAYDASLSSAAIPVKVHLRPRVRPEPMISRRVRRDPMDELFEELFESLDPWFFRSFFRR